MKYKVYYGGWYQRTTLHLSEIYDLLFLGHSNLPLNKEKILELKNKLNFRQVTRENDFLEYVLAKNNNGITLYYYEDGLYLLETEADFVDIAKDKLEKFYNELLNPAISYIFSLGAPTPKVLAHIKSDHPSVVLVETTDPSLFKVDKNIFGEVYSIIYSDKFNVFKTPDYIIIAVNKADVKSSMDLVGMQVFFREFKDQLERYLNIHRTIWEEITNIKDKGSIRGQDIVKNRMRLESYDRSINLINNRINQMGSYIKTRQSISAELKIEEHLVKVFDYKFETLSNTLAYIKEVWMMTKDYVKNVTSVLTEIENQSLNNSIKSLQLITSIGVISGIVGYLTKTELPRITNAGWLYLLVLISATILINILIYFYYRNIKYRLKIVDTTSGSL